MFKILHHVQLKYRDLTEISLTYCVSYNETLLKEVWFERYICYSSEDVQACYHWVIKVRGQNRTHNHFSYTHTPTHTLLSPLTSPSNYQHAHTNTYQHITSLNVMCQRQKRGDPLFCSSCISYCRSSCQ